MKKFLILFTCFLAYLNSFGQLPPAPPTSLAGSQVALTNSINLSWVAPIAPAGTIVGHKVYFSSTSDPLDSVNVVSPAVTTTISNLILNQDYSVYLKSYRVNGADTVRSLSTVPVVIRVIGLVPPSPSADLSLVTHNSIVLRIDDTNPFESGFDIELNENGNTTILTENSGTTVFKTLTGLKAKTSYSIRVRAKGNSTPGPWSSLIYVLTKVDFPPAPILTSDLNCPTLIHLKWTIPSRSEDIEEYILKKSYDNSSFFDLDKPAPTATDYYDQTASPGQTQYYALFTRNSTGSTPSNSVAVTALAYVNPNAPTNPISDQTNKSNSHLTIRWTNGAEDLNCRTNIRTNTYVLIKINNASNFVEYANLPSFASSVKIENLKPKDIVEVNIFSVSDKGKFSSSVFIKDTTAGPPYAPSNPIAVLYYDALGNPAFDIGWKDNSRDEDYFIIERSTDNKNFFELGKIKMDIVSFKDLTPEEATIYYYRVKAGSNTEGESVYSPVIGPFIINPSKAPNPAYGLKAKVNSGKVNLTWYDDSKREENYIVEKSLDAGVSYSLVATLGKNVTSYTDENVLAGKTYLYRVIAKNAIGSSPNSNIASVTIAGVGAVPSLVSLSIFPNPAFEFISIKAEELKYESTYTLKVFDRNNRLALTKSINLNSNETLEIPINNLGQGLYNVVLSNGETSITKKIFKY